MAQRKEDDFSYRKLLANLKRSLGEREFDALKFLCKDESLDLSKGRLDSCENCLEVFEMLEEKLLLSSEKLGLIVEILNLIGRPDLMEQVKSGPLGKVTMTSIISHYRKTVLKCADKIDDKDFQSVKQSLGITLSSQTKSELRNPIQMMHALEKQGVIARDNLGYLIKMAQINENPEIEDIVKDYQQQVVIGRYKMDSKTRGLCIIINNIDFSESKNPLECRKGSEIDQEKLKATFTKLHFQVIEEVNKKAAEMKYIIKRASEQDHSKYDCFVCCIMSHGNLGYVTGTDGEIVSIADIVKPMTSSQCRTLIYKPKLFFIESCRGDTYDTKFDPHSASYFLTEDDSNYNSLSAGCSDGDTQQQGEGSVPEEADFLLAYASFPGKKAKLGHSGSVYIAKLTEVLNKYHEDFDILSMLTLVNREVCKTEFQDVSSPGTAFGQAPSPQFSLRKKLYFN